MLFNNNIFKLEAEGMWTGAEEAERNRGSREESMMAMKPLTGPKLADPKVSMKEVAAV